MQSNFSVEIDLSKIKVKKYSNGLKVKEYQKKKC